MGQYYVAVLTQDNKTTIFNTRIKPTDKENKEKCKINKYDYWVGAKIMEHSWLRNDFCLAVIKKIYNKPGRLAWVGDYTSDIMDEIVSHDDVKCPMTPNALYNGDMDYANEKRHKPVLPENVKYVNAIPINYASKRKFDLSGKYFVNLTLKEYLDMDKYIKRSTSEDGWCINPIPLLVSTGGDQGGGDYHSNFIDSATVGWWHYDLVMVTDKKPSDDFTEIVVTYNENIESNKMESVM